MAFAKDELSCMAVTGAGGAVNHFYFYTNSAEDDTTGSGFFDDVADQITTGDLLYVVSDGQFARLVNTAGVITSAAVDADPTA